MWDSCDELRKLIIAIPDITLQEIKERMELSLGVSTINAIVIHKLSVLKL